MERFEHGGNIYRYRRGGEDAAAFFADFSANINPLGLCPQVAERIAASIGALVHYPDPEGIELKRAIAAHYGVRENWITLGNGAVELLYLLCQAKQPRRVLIPAPSFSEYERAAHAAGAEVDYAFLDPARDFAVDLEELAERLEGVDLLFIGNPNNPTGTLLSNAALRRLIARAAEKDCFVIVDESFVDFLEDASAHTCRSLVADYENLMVLHSLTKFYAVPGLRLGFSLTGEALAGTLARGKDPWNVNLLAQEAGVEALTQIEYQSETRRFVAAEKAFLAEKLAALPGLRVCAPSVNFILADTREAGLTGAALRARLLERGLLIRDCGNYPGLDAYYVRFAVRTRAENERLCAALVEILA